MAKHLRPRGIAVDHGLAGLPGLERGARVRVDGDEGDVEGAQESDQGLARRAVSDHDDALLAPAAGRGASFVNC